MKRKIKIFALLFVIGLVTFTVATGQDKKSEQKIKIIVNDGSGTKVVIDTLITDGHMQDSITLKDGKVIFIGHTGDEHIMKHTDNKDQVYVFVSSDDKVKHAEGKTITIVSSDSAIVKHKENGGQVIVMSSAAPGHKNKTVHYEVVSDGPHSDVKSEEKVIYVTKGSPDKHSEMTWSTVVSGDEHKSEEYSTRSIVAKDGVVVTVEGNDEAKVKELVKEIQKKMGVNPPASEKKETVNTETKKTTKK